MKHNVIPFKSDVMSLPDKSPVLTCGGDIFPPYFGSMLKKDHWGYKGMKSLTSLLSFLCVDFQPIQINDIRNKTV